MSKLSYLGNADPAYIETLYEKYIEDPESIDPSWRRFFEGYEFASVHSDNRSTTSFDREFKVIELIEGYRRRGHLFTKTNPVRTRRRYSPTLDIENFGLSGEDLNTVFQAGQSIGMGPAKLKDIVAHLQQTYCRSIGVEYLFIRIPKIVEWLQSRMESSRNTPKFSAPEKKHIYHHLKTAVGFEQFIHRRFVGQKRFSLEGLETLIPALDAVIEKGSLTGIEEFVIGMSHRGRLNVLNNIMKKPCKEVFDEFNGKQYNEEIALGDVKYHLGYNNEITTDTGKKIKLSLVPNPSHLEAVDPVTLGIVRSRVDNCYNGDHGKIAPILIHGDSAMAGQGVIYEIIQMSLLNGYKTGGTIHLVLNNQVGFTTNYLDARSSTYSTDVGKVTKSPIFHVNGDDVESLIFTVKLALEYRQTFHQDVFIDILGYRRYGHNEGDEPRFTQPLLYKKIASHPNARDIYKDSLISHMIMSREEVDQAEKDYDNWLESMLEKSREESLVRIEQFLKNDWKGYRYSKNSDFTNSPDTGVSKQLLFQISKKINTLPGEKHFFKKIKRLLDEREQMLKKDIVDWATSELLAYGSLLQEGVPVRISGQDSERGTFSHRHASIVIENTDEKYYPLKNISHDQARFEIYNSPLSEYGVLGFEYGYALATPGGLTVWEAQFGDFHNVAQVIIDQYIASAEEKWGIMNGITLFLPHGYEGQGPEHSSARIERFLNMCANNNMQLINCTTPANFFHVLRRQIHRPFRTPLVIFTPKSLLRHPECISTPDELESGKFRELIDDESVNPENVKQVVFTSGRLYYDIHKRKKELDNSDTAIIRIEQLYPFPIKQIKRLKQKYSGSERFIWAQEEPENMGAWYFIQRALKEFELLLISPASSGSPASGLMEMHRNSEQKILDKIFKLCNCDRERIYCGQECIKFVMKDLNK